MNVFNIDNSLLDKAIAGHTSDMQEGDIGCIDFGDNKGRWLMRTQDGFISIDGGGTAGLRFHLAGSNLQMRIINNSQLSLTVKQ